MMEHIKLTQLMQTIIRRATVTVRRPRGKQGPFHKDENLPPGGASEPGPKGCQKRSEPMRDHNGRLLLFMHNCSHHTGRDKVFSIKIVQSPGYEVTIFIVYFHRPVETCVMLWHRSIVYTRRAAETSVGMTFRNPPVSLAAEVQETR
jgi:hypothetical protein